jgi:cytoskeletal protein CcmA (bactofilin family)
MISRSVLTGVLLLFVGVCAFGENSHDRTQFGHNITVGPGEEVSQVTCFGCSVRVQGRVAGDVTTFGGGVVIEDQGQVGGDLTSFGGNLRLEKETNIGGDVTVFGGRIHRDESARIGGDVSTFTGTFWLLLIFGLPFVILGAFIALIVWIVRMMVHREAPVPA